MNEEKKAVEIIEKFVSASNQVYDALNLAEKELLFLEGIILKLFNEENKENLSQEQLDRVFEIMLAPREIYRYFPHFKHFEKELEKVCKQKVKITGIIRWDNWRFDKERIKNDGDFAIVSWKDEDLIKIEFAPELLKKERPYQSYVFLHEIGHIEAGHMVTIQPEEENEIEKEEKEADKFAYKFLRRFEKVLEKKLAKLVKVSVEGNLKKKRKEN